MVEETVCLTAEKKFVTKTDLPSVIFDADFRVHDYSSQKQRRCIDVLWTRNG